MIYRPSERIDNRIDPYGSSDNATRSGICQASPTVAHTDVDREQGLTIVILNLDRPDLLLPLSNELNRARGEFTSRDLGFEVLIGDTGSEDTAILDFYRNPPDWVKVQQNLQYHFSRCNNSVFSSGAKYDTVLFLNNDIRFGENTNSLRSMYNTLWSRRETGAEYGALGLVLSFSDGTLQHAGIDVFRTGPLAGFCYHPHARSRFISSPGRTISSIGATGACLMMRTSVFELVGGFDECYATECQDADICLKAQRLGYAVGVLDGGTVTHYENATRPRGSEDWTDRRLFMRRWSAYLSTVAR